MDLPLYLDRRALYALAVNQFPAEPEKAVEMDIRIYVGNLAKSTTQGEVTSVDLVKDRNSGLSKGFAFVNMTSQESADKAISKYNGYSLAGNELKVNIAKPRVERP
jgi:RNA recognition motif-containing protein